MAKDKYLTAPPASEKMPGGVPYILTNETAERFTFYGMTSVLIVFMTNHLMGPDGLAVMSEKESIKYFHYFKAGVYYMPLVGALLSDIFLGKFRTILIFSIVYCIGTLALVLDITRVGLFVSLALVAVGSGIIKPCVSANVGDQFGRSNKHLLSRVYSWFYFSVNLGACVSMLTCPWILEHSGPRVAFAVPAGFMFLATAAFWAGKWKFVHIPKGGLDFVRETFSGEGMRALLKLCIIYLFVAMFWALFDQSQSAWVLQAKRMELHWMGVDWLPAQVQFVNSLLIMILIPVFAYAIYPALDKLFGLTPLRKISMGLFLTVLSFAVPALVEMSITAGGKPSIGWQFFAYLLLTAGEVMVSITCLEFSYTQSPKKMKSFVMAVFLLSVAVGNTFTAVVNQFIEKQDGTSRLPGASYYWFFTGAMLLTAILFIPVAMKYKVKEYIQDEEQTEAEAKVEGTEEH